MSDQPSNVPALFPLGQDGILVRFGDGRRADPAAALAFGDAVRTAELPGVIEVATSLSSTLVRFAPPRIGRGDLAGRLRELLDGPHGVASTTPPHRLWTIPVSFGGDDGPQLAEAATLAGRTVAQALDDLTGTELSVLAIGFAPGQPYIGHLPDAWDMPRQSGLTPEVPAGALVVALRQLVLFGNPSPTGWRWIGRCAFAPFRAERAEPFALRAGDRIRFASTDADTIATLRENQSDGLGGATCTEAG
ncbi:carboxyltransferase domain-containing protein [Sulfitobacter sp. LCG007]